MILVYALMIAVAAAVLVALMIIGFAQLLAIFAYKRGIGGLIISGAAAVVLVRNDEPVAGAICIAIAVLFSATLGWLHARRLAAQQKQFGPYGRTAQSYHRVPNEIP